MSTFIKALDSARNACRVAGATLVAAEARAAHTAAHMKRLLQFQAAGVGDYIRTVHGPGTVLAVLQTETDHRLRVYLGAGAEARIKNIRWQEFDPPSKDEGVGDE